MSKDCTWGTGKSESSDYTVNKSTTISVLVLKMSAIITMCSKSEVNMHHTPYFHMQMLAIILELFSILYLCYYSQNYSGIIISGLHMTVHCGIWVKVQTSRASAHEMYMQLPHTCSLYIAMQLHRGIGAKHSVTYTCCYQSSYRFCCDSMCVHLLVSGDHMGDPPPPL